MAFGGKPAWDKRAFPETPVTPSATLVSAVRPSLRDKSVPEVKKRKESEGGGGREERGMLLLFHHTPLSSTSGGLISPSGRGCKLTGNGRAEQ